MENIKVYVKSKLGLEPTGHDYYHAERVATLVKNIYLEESSHVEQAKLDIIIAWTVKGVTGPAQTHSPIHLYRGQLYNHGRVVLDEPSHFNTGILVTNGSIKVNQDQQYDEGTFILFDNVAGEILLEAVSEYAQFVVLSGEPLKQPVVAYGPFVMTTKEGVVQAFNDFNEDVFGLEDF